MDKRINYRAVIDTETCPLDKECKEVTPQNMLVYDFGWCIVDKKGNIYRKKSYVVIDTFLGYKNLMKSAYYSKKIPLYWKDIKKGKRKLATFSAIRREFLNDLKEYGVNEIYAHNMRFDYNALNNTLRYLTKSKYRFFFPYKLKICDTLKMSRDVILKMPTYQRFCKENNYLTKSGQPRATAEVLYRYISRNNTFAESHTGLEDAEIETQILAYCYKQHKKMRKLLYEKA